MRRLDSPARSWTRPYLEDSGNLGLYTESSCSGFLIKCPVIYRAHQTLRVSVRVHGSSESAHVKVRAFALKEFCCFCRISLLAGFGCLLFSGADGLKLQYCHTNTILLRLDNVYINVNFSTDLYLILSVR